MPGIAREELQAIAARLQIDFRDLGLLEEALTHKSYSNEAPKVDGVRHNERLEFLGDAVLGLLVSEILMDAGPSMAEGDLSRMRSALVNSEELARRAQALGLGELLRLGKGEDRSGGRSKTSILADTFEALLAAVYLDAGIEQTRGLVARLFGERVRELLAAPEHTDAKSLLQEVLQAAGQPPPEYLLVATVGPDHEREFAVEARIQGRVIGRGSGRSRKAAEQAAASDALARDFDPARARAAPEGEL